MELPLFYAVYSVNVRNPVAFLSAEHEEAETDDGSLGDYWGGTEPVYDIPVGYGELS